MRLGTLVLTAALVAVALPAVTSGDTPPTGDELVAVRDSPGEAPVVDPFGLQPNHGGGHGNSPVSAECGGWAPVESSCSNGVWEAGDHLSHVVVFQDCAGEDLGVGGCFAGTIVSEIIGELTGTTRTFRVDACRATFVPCAFTTSATGDWPFNEPIRHECTAYVLTRQDIPEPIGPGAVGYWSCLLKVPTG